MSVTLFPAMISEKELDARIMALIKQRNDALDREAALSGRVHFLEEKLKELERTQHETK